MALLDKLVKYHSALAPFLYFNKFSVICYMVRTLAKGYVVSFIAIS